MIINGNVLTVKFPCIGTAYDFYQHVMITCRGVYPQMNTDTVSVTEGPESLVDLAKSMGGVIQ